MEPSPALLLAVLRHRIEEPDRDAGLARLAQLLPDTRAAEIEALVADHVAAGLLHDPVRLEPGALQCHWRLELTPAGYAAIETALRQPDGA